MDQATQVERLCTVRPRLLLELTTALRQAGQRPGTISSQPAVYEQTVLRSLRAASRRQALVLTQVSKHLRDGPLGGDELGSCPPLPPLVRVHLPWLWPAWPSTRLTGGAARPPAIHRGLDQDHAGQPQHRSVVGEDADHVRPALYLLVDRSKGVGAPDSLPSAESGRRSRR